MGGLFETSIIQGNLKNLYNKQEVLDYNVYGVTHKCKESKTNKIVAIKIINKKYLETICGEKYLGHCFDIIRKEIEILKSMDGDYSLHLIEGKETPDSFYIITDIWETNLEKYILDKKEGLSLVEIKKIFSKLNLVFKRMDENNIIHGNLKLNNILIKYNKNEIIPILSEYNKKGQLNEKLNIMESTSQYSAPELLLGQYSNFRTDLWSIGVILYRLYFNEFPFNGDTQVAIFNDIKKKKKLKHCEENYYSNDLIKKLLVIDPNYRITWDKYFNHKFWNSDKNENENHVDNNEKVENEKIFNELIEKKDYKNIFKKNNSLENKNIENKLNKKYNIYYCINESHNHLEQNHNNNIEDLKKLIVSVEKDELINKIIYQELIKRVSIENLIKLILYGCNLKNVDLLINISANNLLELDLS